MTFTTGGLVYGPFQLRVCLTIPDHKIVFLRYHYSCKSCISLLLHELKPGMKRNFKPGPHQSVRASETVCMCSPIFLGILPPIIATVPTLNRKDRESCSELNFPDTQARPIKDNLNWNRCHRRRRSVYCWKLVTYVQLIIYRKSIPYISFSLLLSGI